MSTLFKVVGLVARVDEKEALKLATKLMVRQSEYKSSFVRFDGDFYRRLKGRLLFSRGERF
ncbi:hypothetical protein KAI30_04185 [Candidatus Bathyarchaeota archaeon]|nr:hypothetical protein [Candidatus Bathyarchaeota archaeon]